MMYRNLAELQRKQAQRLGSAPALRHKQHGMYRDVSWEAYREMTEACAAALVDAGILPGERVGLLAENSIDWLVADMGILAAAAVNVPMHAPLTAAQIHFQLAETEARWLFVSTREQLDKARAIAQQLPALQGIVIFDGPSSAEARSWARFLQHGRKLLPRLQCELERRENLLDGSQLATIMYTSGTTANPKGVMLTHANLLSNAVAFDQAADRRGGIMFNWLPLSHIYARTVDHYMSQVSGVPLCLAVSPETVVANMKETHPTHLSSVPRFYEKVYTAAHSSDPEKTKKRLHEAFGSRIDWLGSGGAPLPVGIAKEYLEAGLLILQGYGLTESSPVITFNRKSRYKLGTVGIPIPGVEVKIADDGEVLSRGPHIMQGYWNNPRATAETLRDGWLYTGDLGEIDSDGFLTITGRKKDLLVLSNGKKIVPNMIEGLLVQDPCIDQAVVNGEGHNFLTALIVPNWEYVRHELAGAATGDETVLAEQPVVHDLLARHIDRALADVSSYEKIKKFVVLARPFSVVSEELTVSLKLRRNVILSRYHDQLEALYGKQ